MLICILKSRFLKLDGMVPPAPNPYPSAPSLPAEGYGGAKPKTGGQTGGGAAGRCVAGRGCSTSIENTTYDDHKFGKTEGGFTEVYL